MNVIGRCNRNDGQKQKPENGCFTGFLASRRDLNARPLA